MEVILSHKPRGCKGIWQKVVQGDALRVTKGKGKWLKLEIRSQHEIKASDTEIFLLDLSIPNSSPQLVHNEEEGITIEAKTDAHTLGTHIVEVELKLDRVCKKLQFWATTKSPSGIVKGKSIEFSAHNNGKAK
jgi:hypothetical protein